MGLGVVVLSRKTGNDWGTCKRWIKTEGRPSSHQRAYVQPSKRHWWDCFVSCKKMKLLLADSSLETLTRWELKIYGYECVFRLCIWTYTGGRQRTEVRKTLPHPSSTCKFACAIHFFNDYWTFLSVFSISRATGSMPIIRSSKVWRESIYLKGFLLMLCSGKQSPRVLIFLE